ncbi:hypothetical protein KC799_21055 [candidate division KSB1 bacterium]|nr:hypothetical protein [candidate division KSB1 bacterium]
MLQERGYKPICPNIVSVTQEIGYLRKTKILISSTVVCRQDHSFVGVRSKVDATANALKAVCEKRREEGTQKKAHQRYAAVPFNAILFQGYGD